MMVKISFSGARGGGKTVLARAIQRMLTEAGVQCSYSSENDDDTIVVDNSFNPGDFVKGDRTNRSAQHEERFMTVEYHGDKGFKVISAEYPRSLKNCTEAIERLQSTEYTSGRKYGIIRLIELKPVERPAIVTDWVE